ncbi:hypothetical protein OG782_17205 [Streptomyces sp. NBC_00876]|uniref:hypothetical protein n=1 Tax=Streptomyces sp. NBC_00876 TaxID=2975853 RepID=UPI00386A969C|nr:hypothetical protein OG782_17205 [Streptomyces sp. NBC_00876]
MRADARPYRIIALEGIDGSGKTTVVRRIAEEFGNSVRTERLSPHMGAVFRELVGESPESAARYQDVIPGDLRRGAYVIDAISQFHYLDSEYTGFDWLVFDRWLPTYEVYCGGRGVHDAWYRRLAGLLPVPDLLIRVRTSPRVAAGRVAARGDWTADHWSEERLLADLTRLDRGYDRAFEGAAHRVVDGDRDADVVYEEIASLLREAG